MQIMTIRAWRFETHKLHVFRLGQLTAIEGKSMNLAMKAEDNEKKLADAFGELLDFIQTTDTKLNKALAELEESK